MDKATSILTTTVVERLGALTNKLERTTTDRGQREALTERVQQARRQLDLLEGQDHGGGHRYRDRAEGRGGLPEFQARLGDDAVGLGYFLTSEQGYVWVIKADSVAAYEVPGREALAPPIGELLTDLRHPRSSPARLARRARALSDSVLRPVANELSAETLVIIPDGPLHSLPFGVLSTEQSHGDAAEPLIANHQVVKLPSAALLHDLGSRKPVPEKGVFVLADPAFGLSPAGDNGGAPVAANLEGVPLRPRSGSLREIRRLPATRREAEAIGKFAADGDVTMATGEAATLESVKRGLSRNHRVVHLATHGVVNHDWPRLSALLLTPSTASRQVDELRPHEISSLSIHSELVVLSACDTGAGQRLAGEGVLSLTRPFFVGGARQVVSTFWKVSDRGTAKLMESFYRHMLQDDQPPAVALRAAKLEMRGSERWSHPYFWAGFELQGNWRAGDVASGE